MIPGASLMEGVLGAGVVAAAGALVAEALSLAILGLDLAEAAALRLADALPGGDNRSSAVAEGWRRRVVEPGGPDGGRSSLMPSTTAGPAGLFWRSSLRLRFGRRGGGGNIEPALMLLILLLLLLLPSTLLRMVLWRNSRFSLVVGAAVEAAAAAVFLRLLGVRETPMSSSSSSSWPSGTTCDRSKLSIGRSSANLRLPLLPAAPPAAAEAEAATLIASSFASFFLLILSSLPALMTNFHVRNVCTRLRLRHLKSTVRSESSFRRAI